MAQDDDDDPLAKDPASLKRHISQAEGRMVDFGRAEQREREGGFWAEAPAVREKSARDYHEGMTRAAGEGMMYRRRLRSVLEGRERQKRKKAGKRD